MNTRFAIGCGLGLLVFLLINLLAAHFASDCGLPAVFGRDMCADDIARAGWPLRFYEEGGFAYRQIFNSSFFFLDAGIGLTLGIASGLFYSLRKKTPAK